MTPREKVVAQVSRAQGVLMTLYGFVSDPRTKRLDSVIDDTINGLNRIVDLWDGVEDEGEESEGE